MDWTSPTTAKTPTITDSGAESRCEIVLTSPPLRGENPQPLTAMNQSLILLVLLLLGATSARAADFQKEIAPIFKTYCYKCHSVAEGKEKGKLVLDDITRLGEKLGTASLTAGAPDKSTIYTRLLLPKDDDDFMPPAKEKQMSPAEIALVKTWIAEGAKFDGSGAAVAAAPAPAPGAPAMAEAPPGGAPAAGGVQTWSSADGKTIKATMLRVEGDSVVLQRDDGQCFLVPLAKLSPESQALAKK
jgi:hypothetical protein